MNKTFARLSPVSFAATIVNVGTVDGIMKQFTKPVSDLEKLIEQREDQINALFVQEEKLRQQLAISEQKRKLHVLEIQKARDAAAALRTVIG